MEKLLPPILYDLPVPLITPRLLIRPPQIGDGYSVYAAIAESHTSLQQYMLWAKTQPTVVDCEIYVRQAAANWILKNDHEPYLPLFIFDKNTNIFLGATGYHHINWQIPSLEIGYWLRDSAIGQGYMTEAVNALTQYAFQQLLVKRITITCDKDNIRSSQIPKRLHYHLEAIQQLNRRNNNGELSDTLVFVKLTTENLPDLEVIW